MIADWIRDVLAKDVSIDPGKMLGDVCKRHGWTTFLTELLKLLGSTSNETLEATRLLADWSVRNDKDADRITLCRQLANRIMAAVERWDPTAAKRDWQARAVDRGELLLPLSKTFIVLDEPKLLERLVTYVLNWPQEFDLTTVQVPALLNLEKLVETERQAHLLGTASMVDVRFGSAGSPRSSAPARARGLAAGIRHRMQLRRLQ